MLRHVVIYVSCQKAPVGQRVLKDKADEGVRELPYQLYLNYTIVFPLWETKYLFSLLLLLSNMQTRL